MMSVIVHIFYTIYGFVLKFDYIGGNSRGGRRVRYMFNGIWLWKYNFTCLVTTSKRVYASMSFLCLVQTGLTASACYIFSQDL